MSLTLETRASDVRNGRCADCGRFTGRSLHFHSKEPRPQRVRRIWSIDYGSSWLVRGTNDVEQARTALRQKLARDPDTEEISTQMARLIPEPGWFRCNPCICGEEHRFDMAQVAGPGPGNFRGVYFA